MPWAGWVCARNRGERGDRSSSGGCRPASSPWQPAAAPICGAAGSASRATRCDCFRPPLFKYPSRSSAAAIPLAVIAPQPVCGDKQPAHGRCEGGFGGFSGIARGMKALFRCGLQRRDATAGISGVTLSRLWSPRMRAHLCQPLGWRCACRRPRPARTGRSAPNLKAVGQGQIFLYQVRIAAPIPATCSTI